MTVAWMPTQKFFKNKNIAHWVQSLIAHSARINNKYENHWVLGAWNLELCTIRALYDEFQFNWSIGRTMCSLHFFFSLIYFIFHFFFFRILATGHKVTCIQSTPNSICVYISTQFVNEQLFCDGRRKSSNYIGLNHYECQCVDWMTELDEWWPSFWWTLQQKIGLNVLKRLD